LTCGGRLEIVYLTPHALRQRASSGVKRMRKSSLAAVALAALAASAVVHSGQSQPVPFPTKPVEMTVPFGAGNAADVTARHLADGMARQLSVPVPVVNRTGGGGAVAFTHVTQQKADG
jgi:tripartite-type tricarboxylate transporter receptor subunit TctC